jgi:hypothetical protein
VPLPSACVAVVSASTFGVADGITVPFVAPTSGVSPHPDSHARVVLGLISATTTGSGRASTPSSPPEPSLAARSTPSSRCLNGVFNVVSTVRATAPPSRPATLPAVEDYDGELWSGAVDNRTGNQGGASTLQVVCVGGIGPLAGMASLSRNEVGDGRTRLSGTNAKRSASAKRVYGAAM